MFEIPNLEIHVSFACNLACESCSHFSNFNVGGNVSLQSIKDQMSQWSGRLKPQRFSLLGGEPTLNKDLVPILKECNKQWPFSNVQLITNGFYLHKHPELPEVLKSGNSKLIISLHHQSDEYVGKVKPIKDLVDSWDMDVEYRQSDELWRRTYQKNLKPFNDNNPEESYRVCVAKRCPQIHEGKIYKCPQLAYLKLLSKKKELDSEWDKYMSYRPLYPTCSDEELQQFFNTKAESACAMCPAYHRRFKMPSPLK